MTCIAALKHEGKVWMGCDSAQVADGVKLSRTWAKIRQRSVPAPDVGLTTCMLIGGAGADRYLQLAHYTLAIPPLASTHTNGEPLTFYMVNDFVPAWRTCLRENGHMGSYDGGDFCNSGLLIALCDHIFVVGADFSVEQDTRPFRAIGVGEDAAMGSLSTTGTLGSLDPEKRIELALEAAAEIKHGVAPPFHITSF